MAKICYDKGCLSIDVVRGIEGLCRDLYKCIDMASIMPSLLHGDLWSGNILFNINSAVLIDPAIYFGDREMELSFILLFGTFSETFFEHYSKVHPLSRDFYEMKVPLYQIYPLLVHVAICGESYLPALEKRLKQFWATWCPTCKLEAANIERVSKKYEVLTVAVNSGDDEKITRYLKERGLSFRVLNDQEGIWAQKFMVQAFPTTFIYDAKGELKFTEVGYTTTAGLLARIALIE